MKRSASAVARCPKVVGQHLHEAPDKASIRRGGGDDYPNLDSRRQSYQAYNSRARSNAGLARLIMSA
ncbi:MAG TPA: hypothetical protein VNV82_10105, partial [Bryobacteraceae bacterium]|nr:hypothetical protein [Bryobacteraceae bacterium]